MNSIYKTGKKYLGKDISKTQSVLGCVESVEFVIKEAIGQEVGGELSTIKMYNRLLLDRRFQRVIEPDLGDIILSPTNGQNIGHTGIVSDRISDRNFKIMSSNSVLDIWDEHLDMQIWQTRYASFPIVFFRYIIDEVKEVELEAKKISILQKIVAIYQQIISLLKK